MHALTKVNSIALSFFFMHQRTQLFLPEKLTIENEGKNWVQKISLLVGKCGTLLKLYLSILKKQCIWVN